MKKPQFSWANEALGQFILHKNDSEYPTQLRETHDAPEFLYVRGNPALLKQPQLAIVGTRKPTAGGRQIAFEYAQCLASLGLTITSGLAIGIDTAAHQGALQSGSTIAVLGSGLDYIYPKSNHKLAAEIAKIGCVISEYPPNMPPLAHHFPNRNRIISGLSLGVFVIEASLKSGSLITARLGLEQNREIFALPSNPLNPQARGCHHLLKQGAILVDCIEDITNELRIKIAPPPYNMVECEAICLEKKQILVAIGYDTTTIESILSATQLELSKLNALLMELESDQYIQRIQGGYIRCLN